jgi:tRNA pseudouridine32 synthase / 23S rRNA pseudouridine746 synthase
MRAIHTGSVMPLALMFLVILPSDRSYCVAWSNVWRISHTAMSKVYRNNAHQHIMSLSSMGAAAADGASSDVVTRKPELGVAKADRVDHPTISILLETDRFLVVNKPAGIPYHNDDDENLGILNVLRLQLENQRGDSAPRLYGVHRLDRVTSGILLFAKDSVTAGMIQRAFQSGSVVKYYTAISHNKATKKKQGWVQGKMVRGRRKSWYLTRDENGDNFAKTRFFTAGLGHLGATADSSPKTLILFRPYTGKTHQLRVAAKSVGLPLAGDPVYNGIDNAMRTYLHATALHIPASCFLTDTDSVQEAIAIWCPPPFGEAWADGCTSIEKDFREVLDKLVQKHCDCPEIQELLDLSSKNTAPE